MMQLLNNLRAACPQIADHVKALPTLSDTNSAMATLCVVYSESDPVAGAEFAESVIDAFGSRSTVGLERIDLPIGHRPIESWLESMQCR